MQSSLAVLILAAGSSSRLGHPKQLVSFEGESLLRRSVKQALQLSPHVFVVLGHEKEACERTIEDLPVTKLYHEEYAKGIGTSIAFSISHTTSFSHTLIMLCDQPFISLKHYHSLINLTCKDFIIASSYQPESRLGVPAIFPQGYYDHLMALDGDKGAQKLLKIESCLSIDLNKDYAIDIDTAEDIKNYLM